MNAPVRVVLAGGGHSQVEVLRQFIMRPPDNISLTLVTKDMLAPYSGMLPGFIAGHYLYDECHVDVRALARMAGARVYLAEIDGIDLTKKQVLCTGRPPIPFDLLSLNIGSRPASAQVPGAQEFAWPAKPVDVLIQRWQALLEDLTARPRPHRIVVVGAGAGGVELALAMHHRLMEVCNGISVEIISATPDILPSHAPGVRARFDRVLIERNITVHRNETAAEVTAQEVRCASGRCVPYDTLVWTTHAAAMPWLRESGLATDDQGFVLVNNTMQSASHEFVFAAGDVASLTKDPKPKSGVFAVREGPYLADNLRHAIVGRPLLHYRAQRLHLGLISTGGRHAIASRGGWSAEGAWVWRWKDRIDRKWMDRYRYVMPGMSAATGSSMADDMHCAGCGAKLGQEALSRALARVHPGRRDDVLVGLDTMDDAAVVESPPGKLAVHSVDFFPPLLDDAYLAGRVAAVHCLSDLYAMGATPHTALAMAALPHGDAAEDELTDWLGGALSVLDAENAALVGGHTLQGDTPLFGLSVNGFVDRAQLNRRTPQPGDALVLTKPIGIGVIFAADMRGLAQNDWISDGIAVMTQSNANAARIVYEHDVAACTDVTGFGLAGHLLRILRQTNAAATLTLSSIPAITGALAATKLEIRSSLYPSNAAAEQEMQTVAACKASSTYTLLFDPQTAGGLLAVVPATKADACVNTLRAAGYNDAVVIGHIRAHNNPEARLRIE